MLPLDQLNEETRHALKTDQDFRKAAAAKSFEMFILMYLPQYVKNQTPDFHRQIFADLENSEEKFIEVIAFRGSAKSTISTVAYPLWRALCHHEPFIVLLSDTNAQAKLNTQNIIAELENNELLVQDFGPQKVKDEEWTQTNIVMRCGTRIMSRSRGQKIRGLRHTHYRPTLIVADDVENLDDVRTIEQRNKTEEWFLSDVIPSLDTEGRTVLLGNLLHGDSLISRVRQRIDAKEQKGVVRVYPLIDTEGRNLWPEVYTPEVVQELQNKGKRYFSREYLLKIVEADDQVVTALARYDVPPKKETIRRIAIGGDLAISKKESADYTALVASCKTTDGKIYTLRTKYGRWNFNEMLTQLEGFYNLLKKIYPDVVVEVGLEQVGYQQSAIEEAQRRFKFRVSGIKQTQDKRANLESFAPAIERGEILVRKKGHEDLVIQTVHFGYEAHDDLMDAAMISWRMLIEETSPKFSWLA